MVHISTLTAWRLANRKGGAWVYVFYTAFLREIVVPPAETNVAHGISPPFRWGWEEDGGRYPGG